MSRRCTKVLNILISIGSLCLLTGVLFLFTDFAFFCSKDLFLLFLLCQTVIGGIVVFFTFKKTRRPYQLFSGLLICTYGLISILLVLISAISFSTIWPLYGFCPGVSLIGVSCFKYKKVRLNYGIPGFILILMSIYYFLFSFNIIKIPFHTASYFAAPVLIVGILVIFVLYYFLQKHHKELVWKRDDSDDLTSEEFPFPDDDL